MYFSRGEGTSMAVVVLCLRRNKSSKSSASRDDEKKRKFSQRYVINCLLVAEHHKNETVIFLTYFLLLARLPPHKHFCMLRTMKGGRKKFVVDDWDFMLFPLPFLPFCWVKVSWTHELLDKADVFLAGWKILKSALRSNVCSTCSNNRQIANRHENRRVWIPKKEDSIADANDCIPASFWRSRVIKIFLANEIFRQTFYIFINFLPSPLW